MAQKTIDGEYKINVMFASIEYKISPISKFEDDSESIKDYVLEIKEALDRKEVCSYRYNPKNRPGVEYSCHFEYEIVKTETDGRNALLGSFGIYRKGDTYPALHEKTGTRIEVPYAHPPSKDCILFLLTPSKKLIIEKKKEITDIFFKQFRQWISYTSDHRRYFMFNKSFRAMSNDYFLYKTFAEYFF